MQRTHVTPKVEPAREMDDGVCMKIFVMLLVALFLATGYETGRANELINIGIKENWRQADLVIIAVAGQSDIKFREDRKGFLAAEFTIEATLKGETEAHRVLVPYRYSVESSFRCCIAGKRYLLFLNKYTADVYYPVDGRFSLYEIGDNPPKPIP